jgi:hypothetical protein
MITTILRPSSVKANTITNSKKIPKSKLVTCFLLFGFLRFKGEKVFAFSPFMLREVNRCPINCSRCIHPELIAVQLRYRV